MDREPFAHAPTGDFFYEGAGRGAILDELLYILIQGEGPDGIITVTGPAGVGKTTLCRTLMARLPHLIKTLYLDESTSSPEAFLSALAVQLREEWEAEGDSPVNQAPDACLEELLGLFAEVRARGRQAVLLVDEAQMASEETLELLMTLHDSLSHLKQLQIVLFGGTEFDGLLASRQMQDFRQRLSRQFVLQPLTSDNVEDYLMRRMHEAGYRGFPVFSAEAAQLLALASHGLLSRLDRLATKSLQIAWKVSSRTVEAQHVRMASEGVKINMQPGQRNHRWGSVLLKSGKAIAIFSVVAVTVAVAVHNWQLSRPRPVNLVGKPATLSPVLAPDPLPEPVLAAQLPSVSGPAAGLEAENSSSIRSAPADHPGSAAAAIEAAPVVPMGDQTKKPALPHAEPPREKKQQRKREIYVAGVNLAEYKLLGERIEAAAKTLVTRDPDSYTIQLYATDNIHPDRMERFLSRAKKLVDLSRLYVYLTHDYEQARFRVTYGIYDTREEAKAGVAELPERYKREFEPELYTLGELS